MVVGLGVEQPPTFVPSMSKSFFQLCPEVKERPYFLFLSRIHEKKGVDHLIDAYQSILEREKGEIPKLVIAGPGLDDGYGQRLKQKVEADANLRHNVFFPGMLTGNAKWGAFYNCEAFVLPSHQENFGIAVVESLACGKPVLISNQVNIWKEIEQFQAGIADHDTFSGTKSVLEKWMHYQPGQKISMATNALHLYKDKFSVDQFAKQLASFLQ